MRSNSAAILGAIAVLWLTGALFGVDVFCLTHGSWPATMDPTWLKTIGKAGIGCIAAGYICLKGV
ncbi:MAG: hypothetical protein JSV82_02410 [Planctomycetota bacterium]|nr:MAG: hypothetical protein JSV82_02410 [Planctomycetota bacterium]